MSENGNEVFTDEEVSHRILSVITNAKQRVVFITPYLDLWGHAKNAIELAVKRGVRITFLVRDEQDIVGSEDVAWLMSKGVQVLAVERLHVKAYLSDTETIISSMNLLESSSKDSLEMGMLIRNPDEVKAIRGYVASTLMKLARPLPAAATWMEMPAQRSKRQLSEVLKGVCVRCGADIEFNPEKPLCRTCYQEWAEWNNPYYEEQFCHFCGDEQRVTYARPLCRGCYARLG